MNESLCTYQIPTDSKLRTDVGPHKLELPVERPQTRHN